MSATIKTADFEVGSVAHVTFRVRCERLGHGEEVFLVAEGDKSMQKTIALYTTPSQYPWYRSSQPLTLTLPAKSAVSDTRKKLCFRYRYAIHRAGVFHRWEHVKDAPQVDIEAAAAAASFLAAQSDDVDPQQPPPPTSNLPKVGPEPTVPCHSLPLHLMENREAYIVSDVLGMSNGPPDVEHVMAPSRPAYTSAAILHSRSGSHLPDGLKLRGSGSTSQLAAGQSPANPAGARKKHVGFAPAPTESLNNNHQRSKQAVHLNSTDGLVVVSVFLPIILYRSDVGKWTADWDYEVLLSMQTHLRVTRVGTVKWASGYNASHSVGGSDANPEFAVPFQERHLVEECLRPFHCVPVWIDPTLFAEMYNGFCKGVLWPVLHNVTNVYNEKGADDDMSTNRSGDSMSSDQGQFSEVCMDDIEQGPIHGGRGREAELWGAYNTVNRLFAEKVVQVFNEGDLVWVHGFHLLILPSYLTRRLPMAKVGIFLHTPFPSSEIFRSIWCREDLLRGMLNADQVGFHLFEYARHFLTCCRRLLGLNYGMISDSSGGHTLAIDASGRNVVVTSIHAGVEPPILNQILAHPTTFQKAMSIRSQYGGKTIFCAIDRLESLKGIPLKLLAIERLLNRRPEFAGKIVLIQVGISAMERGDDYQKTKRETQKLVHKINQAWPGTVQFQECHESGMGLQQRMALLRAADIMIVTSIRDGLNLLPLEFTIAHQDAMTEMGKRDGRQRGLCILSEFSSCTRVMRGALHVNPWKISDIAMAIFIALTMTADERLRRLGIASEFVTRVTTQRWALAVMLDLKGVHKNVNPAQYSGAGLGLGYRLLGMDMGFKSLDTTQVAKSYKKAMARLILVDYGGTIVSNDNLDNLTRFKMVKERRAHSEPHAEMINSLKGLCEDKRNTVFVVSGKERHSLTKTLGHIPNLGLAAEHGMFISWPTSRVKTKRRWETLVPETDRTWRSLAIAIMEVYTSRTNGSYIEETEMKVLWQYREADTEFGSLQAKELEDHLSRYLRSFPVDILHGGIQEGGYVEVRPKGVNKGVLAMRVLKRFPDIAQRPKVDFALVLGDDHCDEPMLSVMRQVGRRVEGARRAASGEDPLPDMPATIQLVDVSACDPYVSQSLEVFTCTVGKKPSAAASYLHDVDEVQELLESLRKVSIRVYSSIDLRSYTGDVPTFSTLRMGSYGSNVEETVAVSVPLLPKSMSLDQMSSRGQESNSSHASVSRTLVDYLSGLETIDDDDDDAAFCF